MNNSEETNEVLINNEGNEIELNNSEETNEVLINNEGNELNNSEETNFSESNEKRNLSTRNQINYSSNYLKI